MVIPSAEQRSRRIPMVNPEGFNPNPLILGSVDLLPRLFCYSAGSLDFAPDDGIIGPEE